MSFLYCNFSHSKYDYYIIIACIYILSAIFLALHSGFYSVINRFNYQHSSSTASLHSHYCRCIAICSRFFHSCHFLISRMWLRDKFPSAFSSIQWLMMPYDCDWALTNGKCVNAGLRVKWVIKFSNSILPSTREKNKALRCAWPL